MDPNTLSPEQQEFLSSHLKQGKKSKWLEILSQKKGIPLRARDDGGRN